MARKRNLLILVAILLVLIIATVIVLNLNNKTEQIKTLGEVVQKFDKDDATEFSFTYGSKSYSFYKEDDKWIMDGDENFPVDSDEINVLLGYVEEVSATFIIEGDDNYADYGLKKPNCTVNVKCGDDEYSVSFGGYSSMDEQRYVSIGDGNAYLVSKDVMSYFNITDDDIIKLDGTHSKSEVEEFTISGENTIDIVYKEEAGYCYSDEYTYYIKSGSKYTYIDNDSADSLISLLLDSDFKDYVSYKAETENKNYGLDDPALTINCKYLDKKTNEQELTAYIGVSGSNYYLRFDGSELIYKIDSDTYDEFINASYETLKPDEVVLLDWDKVKALDITLDGADYHIDIEDSKYTLDGEEVDFDDVTDEIDSLKITDTTEETSTKKMVTIKFTLDNENFSNVTVVIYTLNGESSIVTLNGTVLGLIDRTDAVSLTEAINKVVL